MAEKRHCKGTTVKGKPCGATPLKPGTEIGGVQVSGDYCRQHDPEIPDSARIGGATPGAGRKPLPRPTDLIRNALEQHVLIIVRPHFRTLGYEPVLVGKGADRRIEVRDREEGGAKIYGESKDGDINMTHHDDLGAMMKAANDLMDRVYGRPKQTTELAGEIPTGDTIFVLPDDDEWHEAVTAKVAEATARAKVSTNGGDPGSNGHG